MDCSMLHGLQYVRLAPGAAERVAPYVGVAPEEIDELVVDLSIWPAKIRPAPRKAWDGRLIAGDPMLLDATDDGLLFASGSGSAGEVLVPWREVRDVQVLGRVRASAGA